MGSTFFNFMLPLPRPTPRYVAMTPLTTFAFGFLLGLRHALDSDHLVAVSTIVVRERSLWRTLAAGLSWGIGHTITLVCVGLLVLQLQLRIPAAVELSFECLVGVVLIVLGLAAFSDGWRHKKAVPGRIPPEGVHSGSRVSATAPPHRRPGERGLGMRPLLVGMVHGLAGSAALMLLVLTTLPSVHSGMVYIGLFGCGSILGMGAVSLVLGLFFSSAIRHLHAVEQILWCAVGLVSAGYGAWIVIEVGVVQGLFLR
ncbi:MAG: urease accessory protein UreH [Candidatus Binatia bacterium]|nr:urease accessory protein UreH [Candidatus Binatia bacterium]